MPIYEYKCTKCGMRFEIIQKIGESSSTICKQCSGELIRIISPAGFVLKGAGFYVNDHPSPSKKKGMEEEKNGDQLLLK